MPRNDLKAYGSVIARIPQDLLDQVKQYASQHRCSVSELIRDGLEMRLEAGEVPGRSTGSSTEHGEEVLHEVLQVLPEVLHTLSPMLLAQIQDTIRTTVTEVLHGHTSTPQPHTQGMPTVLPFEAPAAASTGKGIAEVLPDHASPSLVDHKGMTTVLPKHASDDFDSTRFALGKLCVNGHAYGDTGQTLYRLPKYVCPQCDAARAKERRARRKALATAQEG